MLLELSGSREKKSEASSCFPLSMVCVCNSKKPTLCMGAPGVYIGLPPGGTIVIRLGAGPSRQCLRPPASPPAVGARRLVGPTGCRPLGRQAGPTARVLSAAAYCSLALDDEVFVR